jgi:hypothetical protein
MKTYLAKVGEIKQDCLLFDASEAPVGRLAVRIAMHYVVKTNQLTPHTLILVLLLLLSMLQRQFSLVPRTLTRNMLISQDIVAVVKNTLLKKFVKLIQNVLLRTQFGA